MVLTYRLYRLAVIWGIALLFSQVFASRALADTESEGIRWGLGIGGGVQQKEYVGFGSDSLVIPVLYVEHKRFRLTGPDLDLKLAQAGGLSFNVRAKFALGDGYESSDSYQLTGMADRDPSIWLGPHLAWQTRFGRWQFEALTDTMGNSEGQQASLGFSKRVALSSKWMLQPGVRVTWNSDDYVNYYYGVTAAEALANRPEYTPEATFNYSASLGLHYQMDRHNSFSFSLSYRRLGDETTDSPLVERSNQGRAALVYLYRF